MRAAISLITATIVLLSISVDAFSEDIYLPAIRVELPGVPTATVTATLTATTEATATATRTPTPTATESNASTATHTATATATRTATNTSVPTPTQAATPTRTATATATQTPTPTTPVGAPCPCEADTLNCSDFDTQPEAQACFDWCVSQGAGDIHRLDANNDNVACESLPGFNRVFR